MEWLNLVGVCVAFVWMGGIGPVVVFISQRGNLHARHIHVAIIVTIGSSLIREGGSLADWMFMVLALICELPPED